MPGPATNPPGPAARHIDAALFDLGGVIMSNGGPRDVLARFPGADPDVVVELFFGPDGDTDHPWHRVERGELPMADFRTWLRDQAEARGLDLTPAPAPEPGFFRVCEPMVEVVVELRAIGVRTALVTNNARELRPAWWSILDFGALFDTVVDSHEVGVRKPDPTIYHLAAARVGTPPGRTVFLDDLPRNVAGADAAGMIGVLVEADPRPAITRVRRLAGLG